MFGLLIIHQVIKNLPLFVERLLPEYICTPQLRNLGKSFIPVHRAFMYASFESQVLSPFGAGSEQIFNDHWYSKILLA